MKKTSRSYSISDLTPEQIKLLDHWKETNPILPRFDNDGNAYFLMPMVFTWAIVCGVDDLGYSHRFCYRSLREAISAYDDWQVDMLTEPKNYIKRKGLEDATPYIAIKWLLEQEKHS